jgi:protein-S-isoprenylcysteine O-methyltransferase Ste14
MRGSARITRIPLVGRAAATAGAALFAASLGYLAYSYFVTFGASSPGPLRASVLAQDLALLSAFGIHHSVFARLPVRRWVARHVSPDLERTLYVWTASLLLIGVCALWRPLPGVVWTPTGLPLWGCRAAQVFGVWLTLRSAMALDARALAGLRPSPPPRDDSGGNFSTRGPYGWVRHPIYLGWLLLVLGAAPMTATRLAFATISALYVLIAIPLEERTLRRVADAEYSAYAHQVRWRLLPGLF